MEKIRNMAKEGGNSEKAGEAEGVKGRKGKKKKKSNTKN